ncbi:uncharacterized protein [Antedon mediterranea]|uniref:uncharacterized protein n=1 Tax=Antedon mediterranea TaxID=105859 RepID=UPI003AF798A2
MKKNAPNVVTYSEKMEIEEQPQPPYQLSRKEKFLHYFRKFIQWLFSYVGLTAILVGYLFLGAIIFRAIEQPEEKRLREVLQIEKEKLLREFYNKSMESNVTEWMVYATKEINKFDMKMNPNNVTSEEPNDRYKWSFFGSMLFSLTVVTTIGYGHIAPMTIHGQVICIVYALIGIPLMLLVLTNVGRVLANTARLLFKMYSSQLCKKVRCQDKRSLQRRATKRKLSLQRKHSKKLEKKNSSKRKSLKREPTFKVPPEEKTDSIELSKAATITYSSKILQDSEIFATLYSECNETEDRKWLDRVDSANDSTLRDVSSTNLSCASENIFDAKSQSLNNNLQEDDTSSVFDGNDTDCAEIQEKTSINRQESPNETPTTFASVEDSFLHSLRPGSCSSLALPVKKEPLLVKRRCSCVDLRQFDRSESMEGKPKKEDKKLTKDTIHYSLRKNEHVDRKFYMNAQGKKMTHSESMPNIQQKQSVRSQNNNKYNSLRNKRKQRLHSGLAHPTLASLMKPIDMKIQNSATAIRLATYGKIKGSSREDLTSGISEVSDEDTRMLDWTESVHSRKQLLSSSSNASLETIKRKKRKPSKKKNKPADDELSDIAEIDSDDSGSNMKRTITEADIPITPVLIFFFSYVILGAVMFYCLESGWNLPNAIYFCFITLTTIGFGDYVPDSSLYSLIACCIYTMVGMAITSMCIALIMKKFVLQVKKIGRKVGILKDEVDV